MLKIINQQHYDRVVTFAEKKGLKKFLDERLEYLKTYGDPEQDGRVVVELYFDWAPASFSVRWLKKRPDGTFEHWFIGGLIYHGDQGGWADKPSAHIDPLAVRLEDHFGTPPENPWSVHT